MQYFCIIFSNFGFSDLLLETDGTRLDVTCKRKEKREMSDK